MENVETTRRPQKARNNFSLWSYVTERNAANGNFLTGRRESERKRKEARWDDVKIVVAVVVAAAAAAAAAASPTAAAAAAAACRKKRKKTRESKEEKKGKCHLQSAQPPLSTSSVKMNGANEKVKFLLNWNHFSDHISSCMAKLMTDSSYSDVIIATGDKRMIYAHRFVLANSSKYFQRLLRQMNKQKGVQLVVALPEVKYDIFKILMNYMYRGESQVPHELLPSVIKTGRILEINGLIDLHEADGSSKGASLWNFQKGEPPTPRSVIHSPKVKTSESKKRDLTPCPREKSRSRDLSLLPDGKKKTKCQNLDIDSTSEAGATQKNGLVRRFRPILPKNERASRGGKKHSLQMPLKRECAGKEPEKESPSSSTENSASKKRAPQGEAPVLGIKREKMDENSWEGENQPEEEITIKTELPFEEDEVNYNELLCDFCNESYINPSDWVRHMTDHHGDRGYQTYKELEKEGRSDNVYTCVICSTVLLSAAEWARHLRVWHTDTELAKANKLANRVKKDSESKENSAND